MLPEHGLTGAEIGYKTGVDRLLLTVFKPKLKGIGDGIGEDSEYVITKEAAELLPIGVVFLTWGIDGKEDTVTVPAQEEDLSPLLSKLFVGKFRNKTESWLLCSDELCLVWDIVFLLKQIYCHPFFHAYLHLHNIRAVSHEKWAYYQKHKQIAPGKW